MVLADVFSADEMLSALVVLFRAYFPDFSIFCNLNKLRISQFIHLFLKQISPIYIFPIIFYYKQETKGHVSHPLLDPLLSGIPSS